MFTDRIQQCYIFIFVFASQIFSFTGIASLQVKKLHFMENIYNMVYTEKI